CPRKGHASPPDRHADLFDATRRTSPRPDLHAGTRSRPHIQRGRHHADVGVESGSLMHRQPRYESSGRVLLITPWERQVLQLLADGRTINDAAAGLGMSTVDIETQLTRLFATLGAGSQAEAIAAAHKRGLLTCAPLVPMSTLGNG